jgi:hypothetical protein
VVFADVTLESVDPAVTDVVPVVVLSGPFLNLDVVEVDGAAPRMIATETLRWTAVAADGSCPAGGASEVHDLSDEGEYAAHLIDDVSGDGRRDLLLHLAVPGSGIGAESCEVCVTGEFRIPFTDVPPDAFEARDFVNVTH